MHIKWYSWRQATWTAFLNGLFEIRRNNRTEVKQMTRWQLHSAIFSYGSGTVLSGAACSHVNRINSQIIPYPIGFEKTETNPFAHKRCSNEKKKTSRLYCYTENFFIEHRNWVTNWTSHSPPVFMVESSTTFPYGFLPLNTRKFRWWSVAHENYFHYEIKKTDENSLLSFSVDMINRRQNTHTKMHIKHTAYWRTNIWSSN